MKTMVILCCVLTGLMYELVDSVVAQASTSDTISFNVTLETDAQTDHEVTLAINATVATKDVTVGNDPTRDDAVTESRNVARGNDATAGNDVTVGNDVTKGHDVAKSNDATVSSNATADDQVSLSAGVSAGDDVVDGQSTPDDRRANNGSQNVNYPGGGFSEGSGERMEQVEVLKTCFKMEWSGMNFVSSVIQINVTNNKTQEKLTFSVDSRDSTLMVCDLQEHQSYKVQLSDPGWQSGRVIEKFMWTRHVTPPYPPFPEVEYTTEKSIGLKIFAVDFDWNKGPFSGFNLRIMKSKSLDEVGRQRTEGRYIVGVPLGYSVTVLPTNTDQQFVIGETNEGSNFKLTKDTEYEIYVGTVSTVAHITTHAFVSVTATTSLINIHVIVMFLCFVVGIILLAYTIIFMFWKRKKSDQSKLTKQDELMLYLTEAGQKEGHLGGGGEVMGVIGDPNLVSNYVKWRHPNITNNKGNALTASKEQGRY